MLYKSLDQMIGNTPVLELSNTEKNENLFAKVLVKLEYFNPAGSAKDRVALKMLDDAEKCGKINKDSVIIEPTSGNTGIGLAAVAAARGLKTVIVMPDNMSRERMLLMTAYGAELVLSDGKDGMTGAIKKAEEIAKNTKNSFIAGQFVNPSNPAAHYETTGPEIFNDTCGKVDFLVAGVGTGGTLTGTGKYLKEKIPSLKVVAVEPENSAVLSGKSAGKHGLQGIGAGFIPEITDVSLFDEIIAVSDSDATDTARYLAKNEGVLVGISSGAALFAALAIAKRPENKGKTVVAILPDTGERYLSSGLFG